MGIDAAHLHLMLNHVPVIGTPLLLLLLTIGLLRGSRELTTVSLTLVIGLAAATALIYLTGEPAEELIERAPWVSKTLIEAHEEQALVSLVAALVTGSLAAAALALRAKAWSGPWLPRAVWGALAVTSLLIGWTAWSGGQIRHDEIRSAAGALPSGPKDSD